MNKLKVRRWTGAFGIVACILLIVAFPLYYAFVRNVVLRLRDASKTSPRGLPLMDKVDLYLDRELNKRLGGLGVGLYRLTGGRIARLYKVDLLLLTTRGRRSGKTRTVLLQFFRDGANLVLVAANSGRSSHPGWFYNLKATPTARVQVMDCTLQVHAEEMSADETTAFWPRVLRVAPAYARYQQATSRTIPLVRLVPVGQAGEQTMPSGEALPGREELSFTELGGGIHHGLFGCSFRPPGIARRLAIYSVGEPRLPRWLDPATAWDHLLADYHPGLCPRLLHL